MSGKTGVLREVTVVTPHPQNRPYSEIKLAWVGPQRMRIKRGQGRVISAPMVRLLPRIPQSARMV
jgi:hypothetical protein